IWPEHLQPIADTLSYRQTIRYRLQEEQQLLQEAGLERACQVMSSIKLVTPDKSVVEGFRVHLTTMGYSLETELAYALQRRRWNLGIENDLDDHSEWPPRGWL
ncbi:MAG: hypothetical protein AAFV53_31950, partial [Myxococcota bacterium]